MSGPGGRLLDGGLHTQVASPWAVLHPKKRPAQVEWGCPALLLLLHASMLLCTTISGRFLRIIVLLSTCPSALGVAARKPGRRELIAQAQSERALYAGRLYACLSTRGCVY